MNDVPVIKTFIENGKFYLYDTYTNRLIEVNNEQFIELAQLKDMGISAYVSQNKATKAYEDITMLIDKGMLKNSFVEKIEHPQTKHVPILTDRLVSGITLQVTKKCNFSCRYCVINTCNNIGRNHENVDMSWDVAKKSIDFLYNHSKDATLLTIAFYGGEPMLNYDLIAEVVKYTEKRFFTKELKFIMTINGSVLTTDMIEFFVEHNIEIAISLDGPPYIQNKHRKFGETGLDTFSTVYNNIKNIQKISMEYYDKCVKFIPVVFKDENYQEVLDFFATLGKDEQNIHRLDVSLNGIDYLYPEIYEIDDMKHAGYNVQKMNNKMMESYKQKVKIPAIWHHNGPCLPLERILINTDGEINMCEKVEFLKIGDINAGIDVDLAIKYLNIGKFTEKDCKSCWAMRFCDMCVMNCIDVENHTVNVERKMENCKRIKNNALLFFKKCLIR